MHGATIKILKGQFSGNYIDLKMGVSYSSETSVLTYVLLQRKNLRTRLSSRQCKL